MCIDLSIHVHVLPIHVHVLSIHVHVLSIQVHVHVLINTCTFYWLPKLHKTPYGTRFIAASNRCTTKQLSTLLTSCFKTIINHFKQYCNGIYKHTGVNCFWIIDNSKEVLDRLQNINKNSRATSFDSYDFATLYTNIPHDELKNNIRVLVREAFKVRGAKYLVVDRHGNAHWSLVTSLTAECTTRLVLMRVNYWSGWNT